MSDDRTRVDRQPTDEPDGTTAYEASLRPPGDSVTSTEDAEGGGEDFDAEPDAAPPESRAGYDVDAAAGDSNDYRPEG
jgi:hypothetical protein